MLQWSSLLSKTNVPVSGTMINDVFIIFIAAEVKGSVYFYV